MRQRQSTGPSRTTLTPEEESTKHRGDGASVHTCETRLGKLRSWFAPACDCVHGRSNARVKIHDHLRLYSPLAPWNQPWRRPGALVMGASDDCSIAAERGSWPLDFTRHTDVCAVCAAVRHGRRRQGNCSPKAVITDSKCVLP